MAIFTGLIWISLITIGMLFLKRYQPLNFLSIISLIAIPYSKLLKALSRIYVPKKIRSHILKPLASLFHIDLSGAKHKSFDDYSNFLQLFTREPERIEVQNDFLVSPCEGRVAIIDELQVDLAPIKSLFIKDIFKTYPSKLGIYLSPSNLHRVYSPVEGELLDILKTGRFLATVNNTSFFFVNYSLLDNLSVWFRIKTINGLIWLGMVGAIGVGSIYVAVSQTPKIIKKGEELGVFELGSFVWILSERKIKFVRSLGQELKIGQSLI